MLHYTEANTNEEGTIYNYFENKTALLLGLLNRLNQSDQWQEHFAQSADLDIADFVHGYVKHRLERFGADQLRVLQVLRRCSSTVNCVDCTTNK